LRLANVRWILSPRALPDTLVALRASAHLPGLIDPLRLYEVPGALPRAFWVPTAEVIASRQLRQARLDSHDFDPRGAVVLPRAPAPLPPPRLGVDGGVVRLERLDPHTLLVRADTPPGYIVVIEGYNAAWRLHGPAGPLTPLPGNGRYWAIPTPGGALSIEARFQPRWLWPALLACAGGCVSLAFLSLGARRA
jgi:hypothetical protein